MFIKSTKQIKICVKTFRQIKLILFTGTLNCQNQAGNRVVLAEFCSIMGS